MKIFALYTSATLLNKPPWLDRYKEEFGDPADYHVSLIMPRYIDDARVSELKERIGRLVCSASPGKLEIEFSRLILEAPLGDDDGYVMLGAEHAAVLHAFQRNLVTELRDFTDYVEAKTMAYETNFMPHITIGYDLSQERYDRAIAALPTSVCITVAIDEVILPILANQSAVERTNPANLTHFKL